MYYPVKVTISLSCRRMETPQEIQDQPGYFATLLINRININDDPYNKVAYADYIVCEDKDLMTLLRRIAYEVQNEQTAQINAPHRWDFSTTETDGPPVLPAFECYANGRHFSFPLGFPTAS